MFNDWRVIKKHRYRKSLHHLSIFRLQSCAKYVGTTHKSPLPPPPLTMLKCFHKLILLAIFLTQHCGGWGEERG